MNEELFLKVKSAYTRLKSYVYYDNFNLVLRAQIAKYESEGKIEDKLKIFSKQLNAYSKNTNEITAYFQNLINEISVVALPKTLEPGESKSYKEHGILTNVDDGEKQCVVKRKNYLIDASIEIHLIATLWIQEEGVFLSKKIDKDSYGYHLLTNSEKTALKSNRLIFTPYFEKYQAWRDKGLQVAKNVIEDGNDVTLLSLDIKSFFPSTLIDFKKIKKDIIKYKKLKKNSFLIFTELLNSISNTYHKKLGKETSGGTQLPIGLISSGVIANWHLHKLDVRLKESLAPAFYGRYVDDIFIVLSNVKPPQLNNAYKEYAKRYKKEENELVFKKYFIEKLLPGDTPVIEIDKVDLKKIRFCKPYSNLELQTQKIRIFYFNPEWPLALLNKFAKTLKENSSAFWFLPEEEELKNTFEDKAFDLHYEDSFNKFRSVVDVKSSKYGASVFLAKRIKLRMLSKDSDDQITQKEIARFFKGPNLIELFGLWEKVFTYYTVINNSKAIEKFYKKCLNSIDNIKYKPNSSEYNIPGDENLLKKTMKEYLQTSASLAISLNPKLIESNQYSEFKVIYKDRVPQFRKTALYRHHYLLYTFLTYTKYGRDRCSNLLINKELLSVIDPKLIKPSYEKNNEYWLLPKQVYVQELSLWAFYLSIINYEKLNNDEPLFSLSSRDYELKNIFKKANDYNLKEFNFNTIINLDPKLDSYRKDKKLILLTQNILFKNKKNDKEIKVGLANVKIYKKDLIESISNQSITSSVKRKKILHILNDAENQKSDILVLPENSIPVQWLYQVVDESRRKNRAIIFGLEHFSYKETCYNIGVVSLPFEWNGVKDSLIIPRVKNHYSHYETCKVKSFDLNVPMIKPALYHLFKWKGLNFTLYNCFELANITHRSLFKSKIDALFAIEYNRDVNYFSNVVESTCRDLHCYVIQANSRDFGDTRIVEPSETYKMNPVRIKGGENDVVLLGELNVSKLRKFQRMKFVCDPNDKVFKPTPPDFDHSEVKKRK